MGQDRSRRGTQSTTVTIPVQSLSTGPQAANAFPGWESPPTTVFVSGAFGGAKGTRYMSVADSAFFVARTQDVSRDQEVTTFMERGSVYLRLTPGGRALAFSVSTETNGYGVHVLDGLREGIANPAGVGPGGATVIGASFITPLPAIDDVPGWNPASNADKAWTFGVEGFDVYLKYDGVEFWRSRQFYHLEPGRIALGAHPDQRHYGFRDVSAVHKASIALTSDLTAKIFDLSDFGMKSLVTTGSMEAGATTLTVARDPGFAVGDRICIAVGGEAGGGVPGERGVGGQWPRLLYANLPTRDSDRTQVPGKICGVLSNGNTYRWDGKVWVSYDGNLRHYLGRIVPWAHVATITAISGTTFTLDEAATAATTGAAVYFDSAVLMANTLQHAASGFTRQTGATIRIPPGTDWCFANANIALGHEGLHIVGAGEAATVIVCPPGTMSRVFNIVGAANGGVRDLAFRGSCRADKGYMFGFHFTTDAFRTAGEFCRVTSSDGFVAERITGTNHAQAIMTINGSTGARISDATAVHETGHADYFQWAYMVADSTGCLIERATFDCPVLMKGLESFRSVGSVLRGARGRNACISSNSDKDLTLQDCAIVYERGCGDAAWNLTRRPEVMMPSPIEPLVNLNSNIDNSSGSRTGTGILVENCDFDVQGPVWSGQGLQVISVSGAVDNVIVRGKYKNKPVSAPSGRIRLPDLGRENSLAFRCDDATKKVLVEGIRVETAGRMPPIGSHTGATVPAGMTVRNCVVDRLPARINGTVAGNITNAAYEAS